MVAIGFGDYPRVGGEEAAAYRNKVAHQGLPPRGRGRVLLGFFDARRLRITPAWAGKRSLLPSPLLRVRDYPRVGGEEREAQRLVGTRRGLPPRGRGRGREQIFAPATAPDYPRVGGEEKGRDKDSQRQKGLPPRGRGRVL